MIVHVVLFKVKSEFRSEREEKLKIMNGHFKSFQEKIGEVKKVTVTPSIPTTAERNYDVMAAFEFEDEKSLDNYIKHPVHQEALEFVMETFEVAVFDYLK